MLGMVRDTWRAVLVLVVGVILIEVCQRPPAPPVATSQPMQPAWPAMQAMPHAWQPVPVQAPWPQSMAHAPEQPLRRVASALTELGDSVIGVVRR